MSAPEPKEASDDHTSAPETEETMQPSRQRRPLVTRASAHRRLAARGSGVTRDAEAERALRQRVTQGLPKSRRYFDPNRIEIELPAGFTPSPASSSAVVHSSHPHGQIHAPDQSGSYMMPQYTFQQPLPHPATLLGAGRVDPFANYPIRVSNIDKFILDQLFTSPDPALRTFRESWLPVAINDAAIFHQVLASVASRMRSLRGEGRDNPFSLEHHSLAMRTVNEKLSDPNLVLTDLVIAGVAILVCYSIAIEDHNSFEVHMNGLAQLVQIRGGSEVFVGSPTLRRIIFGIDVSGGYRHDIKPRFPFPERFLLEQKESVLQSPPPHQLLVPSRKPWHAIFPELDPLNGIFNDVQDMMNYARWKIARGESWLRVEFATLFIDSISHKLLSMSLHDHWDESFNRIHEATRLGIILFFGEIRRKAGALAVSTILQMRKLKAFLMSNGSTNESLAFSQISLWILFFGFFESWQQPEYDWYLEQLVLTAKSLHLLSYDFVVDAVRAFIWFGEIHDDRLGRYRESFQMKLAQVI